jgi:hypothetical protein
MQLAIVRATSQEGGGRPARGAQYLLDGSRPDGLIVKVGSSVWSKSGQIRGQ